MNIQLMDNGSTTQRCSWWKKKSVFFDWKDNKVKVNMLKNRSEFHPNTGVFQMRDLSKDDSDSYTLDFFENGQLKKKLTHELIIEALVSSVHLKPQCLPKNEINVTCTAEGGDSPEFSWTLDGQHLTDAQLVSKHVENKTIILRNGTKGLLRCSVKNHVSEVHEELNISTCGYTLINCTFNGTHWVNEANNTLCIKQTTTTTTPAPNTSVGKTSTLTPTNQIDSSSSDGPWYIRHWPIMVGALTAVLIIGIAAVALLCVLKKKYKKNKDEEHELTYADVRILQQPGRRAQPQMSETVEYGQVKFSNQNQHVSKAVDNNCIYSNVRR